MLNLRRKTNESIQLGANVVIKVLEVTHNGVLLGFEAPDEIPILRTELAAKKIAGGETLPLIGIVRRPNELVA